jgi:type III secretion protein J
MKNGVSKFIVFASVFLLSACKQELYSELSQREANDMIAVLDQNGISAHRTVGSGKTFTVEVESRDFAKSVVALKQAGLPGERFRSISDVFPGDGLVTSPFEQQARMSFALNQELMRTISGIDGVVTCRVHIAIPAVDFRLVGTQKPSASIVVRHHSTLDIVEVASKIRNIVGNAVPGLEPKMVAIAFFEDMPGSGARAPQGQAALPNGSKPASDTTIAANGAGSGDGHSPALMGNLNNWWSVAGSTSPSFIVISIMAAALGLASLLLWLYRRQPTRIRPST